MNVANLDLCRELYELSGWDGCRDGYSKYPAPEPIGHEYRLEVRSNPNSPKRGSIPAYDLGYLIRKLPKKLDKYWLELKFTDNSCFAVYWDDYTKSCLILDILNHKVKFDVEGSTPEDATCLLAIQLFKQGILSKEMEGMR